MLFRCKLGLHRAKLQKVALLSWDFWEGRSSQVFLFLRIPVFDWFRFLPDFGKNPEWRNSIPKAKAPRISMGSLMWYCLLKKWISMGSDDFEDFEDSVEVSGGGKGDFDLTSAFFV